MTKQKRIDIRLSEKDYAVIKKKAELSDMTVSEYLRLAGLNKKVNGFKLSEVGTDEQIPGQMSLGE